jgi:hypothetical protein
MARGTDDKRGKAGDGWDCNPPPLDGRMCGALFRDSRLPLPLLLASPPILATALQEAGYYVPRLPMLRADQMLPNRDELWPAQRIPAWLGLLLDPTTLPLIRQLIAELVAAQSDPTPCWGAGVPTLRQHCARMRALLRAAAQANVLDARAAQPQAWWKPGWRSPSCPREWHPVELYDWFVRHVRRTLRGQVTPRARQHPPPSETPTAPVAPAAAPKRLGLRRRKRLGTTSQTRRRQ